MDKIIKASDTPLVVNARYALIYRSEMYFFVFSSFQLILFQIQCHSVAILSFVLEGTKTNGMPPKILAKSLSAYFPAFSLLFEEIFFNMKTEDHQADHAVCIQSLVDRMKKYFLIYYYYSNLLILIYRMGIKHMWCFITTHGDDERGDLFDLKDSSLVVSEVSLYYLFSD